MRQESILVVDDEEVMRDVLGSLLTQAGFQVSLAESGPQGLALVRKGDVDAAIVDVMLPDMGRLEPLEALNKTAPDLVVVMITSVASVETAITAMKKGAFDYVAKPFKHEELLHILRNGLNQRRLQDENRQLRTALKDQGRFMEIVGKSQRMLQVFGLISQAAPSRSTILVVGESGTGKELVAKAIHTNSPRKDRPFVVVNSGSLPPDLLESNLFGHVKGAFTGAVYMKKGLFELADKGTLFFDEIGNIPLETQAKLLRVMQEREFMRLGGVDTIKVDVRLLAATNIDLRQAVDEGRFRELENVIERGVVLSTAGRIGRELIPENVRARPVFHLPPMIVPPEGISLKDVIATFEKRLIESTLESTGGVQKEAARLLGLKPTTLNEMIKRYGIPVPRERERRGVKDVDEHVVKQHTPV